MKLVEEIPKSCYKCDKGELLVNYSFNSKTHECTVVCQTRVGQAQAFLGPISPPVLAISSAAVAWLGGWIRGNQPNNRFNKHKRFYQGILAESLMDDYQIVQWASPNDEHPTILFAEDHTIMMNHNASKVQQHALVWSAITPLISPSNLTWNQSHDLLFPLAEWMEKREDKRACTSIQYEFTRYNYNGHNGQPDPGFVDNDARVILGSALNKFKAQKRKVMCLCGLDTANTGQAFKVTLACSFGNGKYQKFDCGSCAEGSSIQIK